MTKRETPHGAVSERFMRHHYGASGFVQKKDGTKESEEMAATNLKKEKEQFLRDSLMRELQGPLRDPHECSYCEHCGKPIRQQKFIKTFAWVAEGGDMFCRTSEDRQSLIGHQPKGE